MLQKTLFFFSHPNLLLQNQPPPRRKAKRRRRSVSFGVPWKAVKRSWVHDIRIPWRWWTIWQVGKNGFGWFDGKVGWKKLVMVFCWFVVVVVFLKWCRVDGGHHFRMDRLLAESPEHKICLQLAYDTTKTPKFFYQKQLIIQHIHTYLPSLLPKKKSITKVLFGVNFPPIISQITTCQVCYMSSASWVKLHLYLLEL